MFWFQLYNKNYACYAPFVDDRYSCSICSADFNDWIAKNTSTEFKGSYLFTGEWEMQDWNLGNTCAWPGPSSTRCLRK